MNDNVAVLGGGTMGAGIGQLAALAGRRTTIVDPYADAAEVRSRILGDLAKGAARKRWSSEAAERAAELLVVSESPADVAGAEIVIEAVPEQLQLKRELLRAAEERVPEDCVLATNTSSLSVGAIGGLLRRPQRLVGMHFFNPAPLMPLVEVIATPTSASDAIERVRALGEAMGRHVILASDGPGFIVNRCNRPFALEALGLLDDGVADPVTIDRVVRLGGGFRMGPFELQDLVGLDIALEVSKVFAGHPGAGPRWAPSATLERMVEAGRLGRKSGAGWYDYPPGPDPIPEPIDPAAAGEPGTVAILGDYAAADQLRSLAAEHGWRVVGGERLKGVDFYLDLRADPAPPADLPAAVLLASSSLAAGGIEGAAGFHALAPIESGGLLELAVGPKTSPASRKALVRFASSCGLRAEQVGDAPGLILGRIVSQLVNEAFFALEGEVGDAADIDLGMELGMGNPRGPFAWGDLVGLDHLLAVLDALASEAGGARYAAAPLLRRRAAAGNGHR